MFIQAFLVKFSGTRWHRFSEVDFQIRVIALVVLECFQQAILARFLIPQCSLLVSFVYQFCSSHHTILIQYGIHHV